MNLGRGPLPKAYALKKRKTGVGNGRRGTLGRDQGTVPRQVWMRMVLKRLISTRQETAGGWMEHEPLGIQ